MDLLLIGTSHRTAGVALRGRLAAASDRLLCRAPDRPSSIAELFVLATCHRFELYAVAADLEAAQAELGQRVWETSGSDLLAPSAGTYVRSGLSVAEHLCRVACGLDSMIVGEAEIVGQIRRAATAARERGTLGELLEDVLARARYASGRARSETRIGVGAMSAATAAVSIVERALGSLTDRGVLVVGAGEAGRQALARLAKRKTGRLLVTSRSLHHAREAATKSRAEIIALDHIDRAMATVDAVIVATRSSGYMVDIGTCPSALTDRLSRPLVVVDLSVPRVVDPAIGNMDGVTLLGVDDLGDVVRESIARRVAEVPRVERIVRAEAARAYARFGIRQRRRSAAAVA